jgi:hypothetical protein
VPVDVTSRYWSLGAAAVVDGDGESAALPARLLHRDDLPRELYQHRLTGVETIEYVAWRYYGRSESWWVVADANDLVFPLDLAPGATLRVPPASGVGRVLRTRSF